MAWYYGKFACGCEGRVNVIGPKKQRQWKIDRAFEKLCCDCWEKKREKEIKEENERALEKTREMEFPELTSGTQAQIDWAKTLRIKFYESIMQELNEDPKRDEKIEYLDILMANEKSAHFFINNRGLPFKAFEHMYKINLKEKEIALPRAIKEDSTLYPINQTAVGQVEIRILVDKIGLKYEKNSRFREIVKQMGYSWNQEMFLWEREITELTGTIEDRAAEIGNILLNSGFPVTIINKNIREMALNGTFSAECKRWISYRKKRNRLVISFPYRYEDELYTKAKSIKTAYYNGTAQGYTYISVSMNHFLEVLEFAKLFEFKITKAASLAIQDLKYKLDSVERFEAIVPEKKEDKDGLREILESSDDIIPDLMEVD